MRQVIVVMMCATLISGCVNTDGLSTGAKIGVYTGVYAGIAVGTYLFIELMEILIKGATTESDGCDHLYYDYYLEDFRCVVY